MDRRTPLHCEPIARLTSSGLSLRAVEVLAGGPSAVRFAAEGRLLELDTAVAESCLGLWLPAGVAIHLNLPALGDGRALGCQRYVDALGRLALARPLVLEISERTAPAGFVEAFQIASAVGAALVVDDLAPGNSAWRWLRAQTLGGGVAEMPFGGKIDCAWFQHSAGDPARWLQFCEQLRDLESLMSGLTVEGVERLDHLSALRRWVGDGAGLDVQGYAINDLFEGALTGGGASWSVSDMAAAI